VSQACYNLINDFTFTAGPVSIAAAGNTAVYPRHLARLALLTDFGAPATLSWQAGAITCWVFLSDPLSLQPYEAQEDPQGGFIYEFPNTVRGVNGWDGSLCYSDIGITQTDVQVVLSKTGQLDNLQNPSEITPTALTITGW